MREVHLMAGRLEDQYKKWAVHDDVDALDMLAFRMQARAFRMVADFAGSAWLLHDDPAFGVPALGIIDSEPWTCARCHGPCIGGRPADSVCRGCGGA
jgi:hypothetical protein